MNLQEFISKFASQFEDEDPSVFTADTDYHELDSWSSLTGLSVVARSYKNTAWNLTARMCARQIL